jgi:multiple sugar transport system ATP-binding protein
VASIVFKNIAKNYGQTDVIRDISLEVRDGEFIVFVGPSGCGKSTTLRMVAGLETISSGDLLIDGVRVNDLGPAERGAAMVFQSYALYPHMTVEQNMSFGLRMTGHPKAEIAQRVQETAQMLQLVPLLQRYPKQLSGGQRQRVAIGRAIVRRPKLFLFDEPLSNLDAALRVQLRIELAKLHQQLKTTMVYVTHDQTEAMTLGDRIAVFNQGRIEQLGTPVELYQKPVNRFVAEFLGSPKINVIDYRWDASRQKILIGQGTELDPSFFRADPIRLAQGAALAIRPEHCVVSDQPTGLGGTVEFVEYLGDTLLAYLRLPGVQEHVRVKINQSGSALKTGQAVSLSYAHSDLLIFGGDGRAI